MIHRMRLKPYHFSDRENDRQLAVVVRSLHRYADFTDLFKDFPDLNAAIKDYIAQQKYEDYMWFSCEKKSD